MIFSRTRRVVTRGVLHLVLRFMRQRRRREPGEVPLQPERCQISERKPSELGHQVIGDHASRTILGRFGHQRHDEGFVAAFDEFFEVCCGADKFQALVLGPEIFGTLGPDRSGGNAGRTSGRPFRT
jgi:hypothetical protein